MLQKNRKAFFDLLTRGNLNRLITNQLLYQLSYASQTQNFNLPKRISLEIDTTPEKAGNSSQSGWGMQ